jgi:hypothetical protein
MRTARVLCAVLFLVWGTGELAAQGGGMGGRHGGGRRGGGGYRASSAPADLITDPVVWDGPPSFAELPATLQLSAEQKDRYNAVYDTFMLATKQVRDQARANRSALDHGGPGPLQGGSDAAGGGVAPSASVIDDLKAEGNYLEEKQGVFDKILQTFFSKSQVKEYKQWRKAQRKQAEAEHQQHDGMRGRGRPPS